MQAPRRQFGWRLFLGAIAVFLIWHFFVEPRSQELTAPEQAELLRLAREQLTVAAAGGGVLEVDEGQLPERLLRAGTAFVTLTAQGALRGCMVDSFEPHEALYRNVLRNAVLAARADVRFPPVSTEEVAGVRIAISVLSPPEPLAFETPDDLLAGLKPRIDGVVLTLDGAVSTYLPEVWETFPDPEEFLSRLCEKAGLSPDRWRQPPYPKIETYHAFRFEEP